MNAIHMKSKQHCSLFGEKLAHNLLDANTMSLSRFSLIAVFVINLGLPLAMFVE